MNRFLIIADRARGDLNRVYRWLERRSPRGAISWYRAFWSAAMRATADPEAFPVADEAVRLKRDIRLALFKTRQGRRYRLIFDFSDTEVRILRVEARPTPAASPRFAPRINRFCGANCDGTEDMAT